MNSKGVTVEPADRHVEPATMVKFPHISAEGAAPSRAQFSFSTHSCSSESSHVLFGLTEYLLYGSVTRTQREDARVPSSSLLPGGAFLDVQQTHLKL